MAIKRYRDVDVMTAAQYRIRLVFDKFERIYVVFELINPFDPDYFETSISGKPVEEESHSPVYEEFLEMLESQPQIVEE